MSKDACHGVLGRATGRDDWALGLGYDVAAQMTTFSRSPLAAAPWLLVPWLLVPWLLVLTLSGSAQSARLTVYAAASLTDALTEVARAFDRETGNQTTLQFAGSQMLRTQLEQGARADVYASANAAQFEPLVRSGIVLAGRTFATNRLALIAPVGRPQVRTLADLAQPGVRVVLADPAVPVGTYTRQMLSAVDKGGGYGKDFSARVLRNVVSEEPNVRQVALKVQLGEADAAVVYSSDVTPALRPKVRVIALPSRFNQQASYPVGLVKNTAQPQAAQAFVRYLLSGKGQAILKKWGFGAPK